MTPPGSDPLAARLPPDGLTGLQPPWSRLVDAPDADGIERTWHVLDRGPADPRLTLLCVHGNPTWSYLWRGLLAAAPADLRVVAVDQLDMGWSERTGRTRRLADRIDDLDGLVDRLGITSPVVTIAHDWGGPVSLGWAERHRDRLAGVVLTNTAVHQPPGAPAPALIRLARSRPVLPLLTVTTDGFVRGTAALSATRGLMAGGNPRGATGLPPEVRAAFRAPYGSASRRVAVGAFVADIPLEDEHPSMPALRSVADGLAALADVPVLLLWGPDDPVFSDLYLRDLLARLPHAEAHRYEGASHLVLEDAPEAIADLLDWVADLPSVTAVRGPGPGGPAQRARDEAPPSDPAAGRRRTLGAVLAARADDAGTALVELGVRGPDGPRRVSWAALARVVADLADGLAAHGIRPGDRVALLVPPGADLIACVYACWRLGAVVVVADSGLGPRGMRRALRGAHPDHVIGIAAGLALARTLHVPGLRILAGPAGPASRSALGARATLAGIAAEAARIARSAEDPARPGPGPESDAVVVFTSGATGPAKGVVYRHRQLEAQRDALASCYAIGPDDALVAAFAPWAVLGPALGIPSAIPALDLRRPGDLTATALADAAAAVGGTLLWASPAVLGRVVATAAELDTHQRAALAGIRLLLAAGAPVPAALLRSAADLMPAAEARTPYGMTEALPLTDVTLAEIEAAGPGQGVLVGTPLPGVDVAVSPLDPEGRATGALTSEPGCRGEIAVRAGYLKDRYDRLWATQRRSSRDPGWHRTGDVGHLDAGGRLWIEGRLAHVITTAAGPLTPVGPEQRVEQLPGVRSAAFVGVGPAGTQAVVVVVVPAAGPAAGPVEGLRPGPAGQDLLGAVRAAAGVDVAAVLQVPAMPVDIRHNSKIDRIRLGRWAERVLAGGRAGRP